MEWNDEGDLLHHGFPDSALTFTTQRLTPRPTAPPPPGRDAFQGTEEQIIRRPM